MSTTGDIFNRGNGGLLNITGGTVGAVNLTNRFGSTTTFNDGVTTLTGDITNTYGGIIVVNDGTVGAVNYNNNFGSTTTINGGTTTLSAAITNGGDLTQTGGTLAGDSLATSGTTNLNAGTTTITNAITNTGTTNAAGATVTGDSLTNTSGTTTVSAGSVAITNAISVDGGELDQTGGALSGLSLSTASGATTDISGGTTVIGLGGITNRGTTNLAGTVSTTGDIFNRGNGGLLNINGGTLDGVNLENRYGSTTTFNDGVTTLTGDITNTYGGDIMVNDGSVNAVNYNNNFGATTSLDNGTVTLSGTATNAGTFNVGDNTGVANTATLSTVGGVTNSGTLNVRTDGHVIDALDNTGTVNNAGTYDTDAVVNQASGTINNGTNASAGTFNVTAAGGPGTYTVDNAGVINNVNGMFTVTNGFTNQAGATTNIGNGTGAANSAFLAVGGALANAGTLTVRRMDGGISAGSFTQSASGTLNMEVNTLMTVAGNASLGGIFNVNTNPLIADPAHPIVSNQVLISVGGAQTGAFSNVHNGSSFLTYGDIDYQYANNIGDGNDVGVVAAVSQGSTVDSTSEDVGSLSLDGATGALNNVLDRLSLHSTGFLRQRQIAGLDASRATALDAADTDADSFADGLYLSGTYSEFSRDLGLHGKTNEMTLGWDHEVATGLVLGAAMNYGDTDWARNRNQTSGSIEDYNLTLYAACELTEGWRADAALGAGYQNIGTSRNTASGTQRGNTDAWDVGAAARIGYLFTHDADNLLTYGGLRGVYLNVNDYTEQGSVPIHVGDNGVVLGQVFVGATWAHDFKIQGNTKVTTYLTAEGFLADTDRPTTSQATVVGSGATARTLDAQTDSYGGRVLAGVNGKFDSWSVGVEGGLNAHENGHGGEVRLTLTKFW